MKYKTPEQFHNRLSFLFHVTLALPLAAFVYLFLEIRNNGLQPVAGGAYSSSLFEYLLAAVGAVIAGLAFHRLKKDLQYLNKRDELQERLKAYVQSCFMFYMLVALASAVFVLGLYLTTAPVFIFGYVTLLFLMSLNRPTPRKYVRDLHLNEQQRNAILHKGSFDEENEPTSREGS